MSKKEWMIVLFPLLVTWGIDRVTKQWATALVTIENYGHLSFILHHNHGAMLGLFSDLPTVLRVVSLSTGGAFLICSYAIIQYLLPIKSLILRSGMSILLGGILGNVTDRIIWGYVVDFIVLGTSSFSSPAFNMADALQWVGYAMIVYSLIRESEILWPADNLRKTYWVLPNFQIKYCLMLVAVGLSLALVVGTFSYTYLNVSMKELVGNNTRLINQFLIPYIVTFVVICVFFTSALFLIGRFISHKIAGPVYAFERFLTDNFAGKDRPLNLRSRDEFKHLEKIASEVRVELRRLHQKAGERINQPLPPTPDKTENTEKDTD